MVPWAWTTSTDTPPSAVGCFTRNRQRTAHRRRRYRVGRTQQHRPADPRLHDRREDARALVTGRSGGDPLHRSDMHLVSASDGLPSRGKRDPAQGPTSEASRLRTSPIPGSRIAGSRDEATRLGVAVLPTQSQSTSPAGVPACAEAGHPDPGQAIGRPRPGRRTASLLQRPRLARCPAADAVVGSRWRGWHGYFGRDDGGDRRPQPVA